MAPNLQSFVTGFSHGAYTAWVLAVMLHKVLSYLFLSVSNTNLVGHVGWSGLVGQTE